MPTALSHVRHPVFSWFWCGRESSTVQHFDVQVPTFDSTAVGDE